MPNGARAGATAGLYDKKGKRRPRRDSLHPTCKCTISAIEVHWGKEERKRKRAPGASESRQSSPSPTSAVPCAGGGKEGKKRKSRMRFMLDRREKRGEGNRSVERDPYLLLPFFTTR